MTAAGFTPTGAKVACDTCGRQGYDGAPWQEKCRAGHPHACSCGRLFATLSGLTAHRLPRRPLGPYSTPHPHRLLKATS